MGRRTPLGIGLEAIHVMQEKKLATFCPCPETLSKAVFKGGREISRQPSTQAGVF
jgi:hypothetical protein